MKRQSPAKDIEMAPLMAALPAAPQIAADIENL
jgi:hypothetical protein